MLANMANKRMFPKITKFAFIFYLINSFLIENVSADISLNRLQDASCLSPKTLLTKQIQANNDLQLEKILKIIYPHFDSTYKHQALSLYRQIIKQNDIKLLLHHLFKYSSDGFEGIKAYNHWDADTTSAFPKTVDKTQWIVITSATPFSYSENRYNDNAIDSNFFTRSIKLGDKYIALISPVHNGGKKKIVIEREGQEQEIHYFKRENIKIYITYTLSLLDRFQGYIKGDTSDLLTKKMSSFLNNKLGKEKIIEIFSDFDIDTRGNYVKKENNNLTIFPIKNVFNNKTKYISIPFKLINAFKRGRIHLSEHKLLNLMLLDLAEHFNLEKELESTLTDKEKEFFNALILFKNRLYAADLKNESDVRLLQLNARVPGQRPKDITDKQIEEWKNAGVNMLYFMGVWETSPFSKAYNLFWGATDDVSNQREASAFAIKNYRINPEIASSAEFNNLRNRLKKAGIKVMLDFVPNHMAMDNDYLPKHPEYFMHDKLSNNHYIDTADFDSFDPANWEKHQNGKTKYRIWYSKSFDKNWGSDHFLMQEIDSEGRQIKVTKFYHGNWSWRDTVQINYQNPKAREFMRKNAIKAAYRADGGGLRWDFVHVVLQKHFNSSWDRKDFKDFLRKWKGVDNIPEKNESQWGKLFELFLLENNYTKRDIADEKARDFLEEIIESFKKYLQDKLGLEYVSLAPAFHFEGLGKIIKTQIYPTLNDENYRELYDSVPDLRFHETIERTVNTVKSVFPDIINIAEAYEEEAYIHNLGIDAIYGADMHKVLVDNAKEGRSFFDSVHDFFNIVKENSHIWDMKNHVFYMQNFDETPAINTISAEDIMYKSALLYGLPGMKYFEWGLVEGNKSRLGADWIHKNLDPELAKIFKPFFTEIIAVSSDDIITHGSLQQLDVADNVRAYKRKYLDESICVIANIVDDFKQIPLSNLLIEPKTITFKLLESKDGSYIKDGILYLAPKSVIWIKNQKQEATLNTLIQQAA